MPLRTPKKSVKNFGKPINGCMDAWLNHQDTIQQLSDYFDSNKCLLSVYRRVESIVERDFSILLPLKKSLVKDSLKTTEFDEQIRKSDLPMTIETPADRNFSRRIYHRLSIFPGHKHSNRGFVLPETDEEILTRINQFSEGRKITDLKLRKELVWYDLKTIKRSAVYCFESFRFSEKTIEELGEREHSETFQGKHFIYKIVFRNNESLRLRMKSFSLIIGKVLVIENQFETLNR